MVIAHCIWEVEPQKGKLYINKYLEKGFSSTLIPLGFGEDLCH